MVVRVVLEASHPGPGYEPDLQGEAKGVILFDFEIEKSTWQHVWAVKNFHRQLGIARISKDDIGLLRTSRWINDELVNGYGYLCHEGMGSRRKAACYVFNTYFSVWLTRLKKASDSPASVSGEKVSLVDYEFDF